MASFASSPDLVSPPTASSPEIASTAPVQGKSNRWLSREELKQRVKRSPALVKEIYEIAQRQVQAEVGRQGRLDAKATSLMSAVGLCLTVTFTFGSLLLTQAAHFVDKLGDVRLRVI